MLFSLGGACVIKYFIDKSSHTNSVTQLFDWMISDFESIIFILKNIDENIFCENSFTLLDVYCNSNGSWTDCHKIEHKQMRFISIHDISKDLDYNRNVHSYVDKCVRRLKRFKDILINNRKIKFIHLINSTIQNDMGNYNGYCPNDNDVNLFFDLVRKINPNLDVELHILYVPRFEQEYYANTLTQSQYVRKHLLYSKMEEVLYDWTLSHLNLYECISHISYSNQYQNFINIIPIGLNCQPRFYATQLNIKKKKKEGELSYPFDLCLSNYNGIVNTIKNEFKDFVNPFFLTINNNYIEHKLYHNIFNHETNISFSENNFELFCDLYIKRINNWKFSIQNAIKKEKPILFVFNSYTDINITDLEEALHTKYEHLHFHILVIIFSEEHLIDNEIQLNSKLIYKDKYVTKYTVYCRNLNEWWLYNDAQRSEYQEMKYIYKTLVI